MADNTRPVSPVNGQPVPRGRKFTSETAREAQKKRSENARAKKSITAAFQSMMNEVVTVDKSGREYTGAQAIARAIINGAMHGNAKMVEIALALCGETPSVRVTVSDGHIQDLIEGLKEPISCDIHAETAIVDGSMAD